MYLNQKSLAKRINFDFNNDVFDIESVEVSDLNYWAERLSSTDQKYQKMKEISWISKIIKLKMIFMRTLFKSVYSLKENLNEVHLSRKFELWEMLLRSKEKNSVIHINTVYKQKVNKIQLINLERTTDKTLNELINW